MSTVAVHESAHAAVALALGKKVEFIERDPGHVLPGEKEGFANIDLGEGIDRERLQIAIAGYMAVDRPDWPPDWPPDYDAAWEEPLEALGTILLVLALEREEYEELCAQTQRMLDDPDVRSFICSLARVLDRVPRVYGPEILAVAQAVELPIPQHEGALA